ncbi:MAG: response regulator [Actinobacteria bacterium]|nr:MAG: response regulator [Actinomycetota bacterium]
MSSTCPPGVAGATSSDGTRHRSTLASAAVPDVVIVSDAASVRDEVRSAITDPDATVRELEAGKQLLAAVEERVPDLAVIDLQIGNMGGMAACLDIRLEEGMDRLPHVPVLMLLDRRPDVFLARRSQADGWLVKPLDPLRLRKAMSALLAGDTYHDDTHLPPTIPVASPAP